MKPAAFFANIDGDALSAAIRDAELRTSGEIRVHVSSRSFPDVEAAAAAEFHKLKMDTTAARNGVLVFVAPAMQRFAVIGDKAIHERCGPEFWAGIARVMEDDFRAGRFTDGLVAGVRQAGEALAQHFPRQATDVNELPDEVTRD